MISKVTVNGWYFIFKFWATPDNITELEELYRKDDDIIKFVNLKDDEEAREEENKIIQKSEQDEPDGKSKSHTPVGDNNYNYLFGYTDEFKIKYNKYKHLT